MRLVFERYLRFLAPSMKRSSADSYRFMAESLFRYCEAHEIKLKKLSRNDVAAWMTHAQTVEGSNNNTLRGKIRLGKSFLEWCVAEGCAKVNPFQMTHLPRIKKVRADKHPFTHEQFQAVLIESQGDRWRAFWPAAIRYAWHTGLRMSDVAQACWENVDFESRTITAFPMKKSSVREKLIIPIEPELYAHLTKAVSSDTRHAEYVHGQMAAIYQSSRNSLVTEFRNICDKCGFKELSFHSFRHGFVTRLRNAGVDPMTISEITGQSLSQIMDYSHTSIEAKFAALAKTRPPELKVEAA